MSSISLTELRALGPECKALSQIKSNGLTMTPSVARCNMRGEDQPTRLFVV